MAIRMLYTQMTAGGDPARTRIGRVIGEDSLLLTGVVDLEIEMVEGRGKAVAAYNAIPSIDPDGRLGERYAKAHSYPMANTCRCEAGSNRSGFRGWLPVPRFHPRPRAVEL